MPCSSTRSVPRLEQRGLARTLRVVAVVVVARLARCVWWLYGSARTMRTQREVHLAIHNNLICCFNVAEGNIRY